MINEEETDTEGEILSSDEQSNNSSEYEQNQCSSENESSLFDEEQNHCLSANAQSQTSSDDEEVQSSSRNSHTKYIDEEEQGIIPNISPDEEITYYTSDELQSKDKCKISSTFGAYKLQRPSFKTSDGKLKNYSTLGELEYEEEFYCENIEQNLKSFKSVSEEDLVSFNECKESKENDEESRYTGKEFETRNKPVFKNLAFKPRVIFEKTILKEKVKFRFDKYIFKNTISILCAVGLKFKTLSVPNLMFTSFTSNYSEEQLSLTNLSKDIEKLFQENTKFTDIDMQISCNDLKAHKAILFCRCPSLLINLKDCPEDSKKMFATNNGPDTLRFCIESIHLNDLGSHSTKNFLKDYKLKLFEDSMFTDKNVGEKELFPKLFHKSFNSDEISNYLKSATLEKKIKKSQVVRGIHSGSKRYLQPEPIDEKLETENAEGIQKEFRKSMQIDSNISKESSAGNTSPKLNFGELEKLNFPMNKSLNHFSNETEIKSIISVNNISDVTEDNSSKNMIVEEKVIFSNHFAKKPHKSSQNDLNPSKNNHLKGLQLTTNCETKKLIEDSQSFKQFSSEYLPESCEIRQNNLSLKTDSYSGTEGIFSPASEVCTRNSDFSLDSEKELRITESTEKSDFLHNLLASPETTIDANYSNDEEWEFESNLLGISEEVDILSVASKPQLHTSTMTDNNSRDLKLDFKTESPNTKYAIPSCCAANSNNSNSKVQFSRSTSVNADKKDSNNFQCDNSSRETDILHMKNVDPHALYWILRYIYSGRIDINNPFLFTFTCFRVYVYAKKFGLKQLARILAPITMTVQSSIKTEKCSFISIVDQYEPGLFYTSPNYVTPVSKKVINLIVQNENPSILIMTLTGINELSVQYKFTLIIFEKNNAYEIEMKPQFYNPRIERSSAMEVIINFSEVGIEGANIKSITVYCSLEICSFHSFDDSEIIYPSLKAESNTEMLSKDLRTLFESKKFSDVRLRAGDMTFDAHKFILIARSATFATVLKSDTESEFHLTNIDGPILESLLLFIYSGKIDDWKKNHQLYEAAVHYEVEDLAQLCRSYLKNNFSDTNVCNVLVIAHKNDDLDLFNVAKSYVCRNASKVLLTPGGLDLMTNHANIAKEILEAMSNFSCK